MTLLLVMVVATAMLLVWTAFTLGSQLLSDYRQRFTADTQFNLRELYLFADPARLYVLNLIILILVTMLVWLFTGSALIGIGIALALAFLPWWLFNLLKKRRLDHIEEQLPDAIQMLAGTIKAGLSLSSAFRQITAELQAPLAQEFQTLLHEQRLGVSLDDALENLTHRVPIQPIHLMVSAMRIANETGGGLAETLERSAVTLRSQHAMERKIRALTAQGKMQAWVVGLMPVFLLYVLTQMEPEAMQLLWTTRIGWGVIASVIVLEFFGIWFIRKIVAIDV
jgi:tight adherence protein B